MMEHMSNAPRRAFFYVTDAQPDGGYCTRPSRGCNDQVRLDAFETQTLAQVVTRLGEWHAPDLAAGDTVHVRHGDLMSRRYRVERNARAGRYEAILDQVSA